MTAEATPASTTVTAPKPVRARAVAVVAVAGTVLGLSVSPLGASSVWALLAIAAFLAGISDIGGG
jgi:hypothetical protein